MIINAKNPNKKVDSNMQVTAAAIRHALCKGSRMSPGQQRIRTPAHALAAHIPQSFQAGAWRVVVLKEHQDLKENEIG